MEAAISATVTGFGNDFDEPSGRRMVGIDSEVLHSSMVKTFFITDESSSHPCHPSLRSRPRTATAGHRPDRPRAADRGNLFPLHQVPRVGRLRDVLRQDAL